jgi:L-fucono-1,5-lactonase
MPTHNLLKVLPHLSAHRLDVKVVAAQRCPPSCPYSGFVLEAEQPHFAVMPDGEAQAAAIDAHQHFWTKVRPNAPVSYQTLLRGPYGPEELLLEIEGTAVEGTILVQSVNSEHENHTLAAFAARSALVKGIVFWAPLDQPFEAMQTLSHLLRNPLARGVRCLVGHRPLTWATDHTCNDLWEQIAELDVCWEVVPVTVDQVEAVVQVASTHPRLRIIVDHLARPPIETGGWQPWARQVQDLANCPNTAMKVSIGIDVLKRWRTWEQRELERYIEWVVRHFGPGRLMAASNWPVILLRTNYATAWRSLADSLTRILSDPVAIADVLGATARRWYRLQE